MNHLLEQFKLLKTRSCGQWRGGIGDNGKDVIIRTSPTVLEFAFGATADGVMDFLAIIDNETFSRSNAPGESGFVFVATALHSDFSCFERVFVRNAPSPYF